MRRVIALCCLVAFVGLSASACSIRSKSKGLNTTDVSGDLTGYDSVVPDVADSDLSNLDTVEPDTGTPDTADPDLGIPDLAIPDTSDPDVVEPDTNQPDANDVETVEPDITPDCKVAPNCECFLEACVGAAVSPELACGLLTPGTARFEKLVALYQDGACETQCGGFGTGLIATICKDPDCIDITAVLEESMLLPTECAACQCTPMCDGKVCGDDGCGGSCGACLDGTECANGACVAGGPKNCDEAHGLPGCCHNGDVFWFEGGNLQGGVGSCGDEDCGFDTTNGFYACGFSGADPSGTYPLDCFGTNPAPETCPTCSCDGKQCGNDGCGGSCGTCPDGVICSTTGQCLPAGTLVCAIPDGCTDSDPCSCVSCVTDGSCSLDDDCICPDCAADGFCSNASNCQEDGICDMYNEGCICTDCAAHPICAG